MNNFPNGLYGHNTTERQHNRLCGIPEKANSFEEKGACPMLIQTKMKGSLEAFSK